MSALPVTTAPLAPPTRLHARREHSGQASEEQAWQIASLATATRTVINPLRPLASSAVEARQETQAPSRQGAFALASSASGDPQTISAFASRATKSPLCPQ